MSCPIGLGGYLYRPDRYGDMVVGFCRSEATEPIRAVLQRAELYAPLLGSTQPVRDVRLPIAVAAGGRVLPGEDTAGGQIDEFLFVEEVEGGLLIAEEEPVLPGRAEGFALVQEGARGGNTPRHIPVSLSKWRFP